jgi:anti-sigma factor RsiW
MDENLKQLVRHMRNETCPKKVLDEVQRRRRTATQKPATFRYALVIAAAAVILCVVTFWPPLVDTKVHTAHKQATPRTNPERKRIAREAEGALGYIGAVLLDAGTHSGNTILKEAVLPIQNSLQTAKKKITDQI